VDSELFFESVRVGDGITPLEKEATLKDFKTPEIFGVDLTSEPERVDGQAADLGVDSLHTSKIFGGVSMLQFLSEMMTNWLPDIRGWVQGGKLSAKFIRIVQFDEIITCHGQVKEKKEKDGNRYLVCDVWVENADGEKVVVGEATVSF